MKKLALLLLAASVWGQTAPAADPVVLSIGAQKITQSEFELILKSLPAQMQARTTTPEGKRDFANQLAELMMLAQEARTRKLDQQPDIKTKLEIEDAQVLASAVYATLGSTDDAALHAYYDSHKDDMEQIHARHILVRFKGSPVPIRPGQKDLTEDEALQKAKDLRAKIAAGAKFADVAKSDSDDTGSGQNGGDLDSFGRGAMIPEFEKAAFALKVGEVSEPVRSQYGYHLILVESHSTKTFDEAKPELEKAAGPAAADKAVENLKAKVKIDLNDAYFGKEAPKSEAKPDDKSDAK